MEYWEFTYPANHFIFGIFYYSHAFTIPRFSGLATNKTLRQSNYSSPGAHLIDQKNHHVLNRVQESIS